MTLKLYWVGLLAAVMAFVATVRMFADEPAKGAKPNAAAEATKPATVLVTISKATTYITEPLRKDGYVDYVAALDERCRAGVTPENNAAVLFWRAVGPDSISKPQRDAFFKRLGIAPLPETGDYLLPLYKFMQRENPAKKEADPKTPNTEFDKALDDFDLAVSRPWSSTEFPILARWLTANEKPLALLVEASTRPRRYDPIWLDGKEQWLVGVLLPAVMESRTVAQMLAARAMLRASEGKIDAAWDDLLACHRLARLVGQGPTLVDALVATALDAIACRGDEGLMRQRGLSVARARKMLADLDKLAPLPKMVDKIDPTERFTFLDSVAVVARDGRGAYWAMEHGKPLPNEAASAAERALMAAIDWDLILRLGNSWYDRLSEAFRKPTRTERKQALARFDKEVRKLAADAKDVKSLILPLLIIPREAISLRAGEILSSMFLPAITSAINAEDRAAMRFDLTRLGFALAAYDADHGSYPATLAELATKYIAEIPKDLFSAGDLHYKRDGDGYLLYSVGVNGVDDGGKGYGDCKNGEDWDDLAVRVPDSKKK